MVDPNMVETYTVGKEGFIVALCEALGVPEIFNQSLKSINGRPVDIPYGIDAMIMMVNMCHDHRALSRLKEYYEYTDLEGLFHYPISLDQINDDRFGGFLDLFHEAGCKKIFSQIAAQAVSLYGIDISVFGDSRGYFMETYNYNDFKSAGLDIVFVQDNQSKSKKGVLRGLHFQKMHPQGKLVRVIKGKVFDVAVDIRKNSKTFGKWVGATLSEENKRQFYVPQGFAHGFLVLSDEAEFCFKCTDFYDPQDEGGIAWNDPGIGIKWPVEGINKILLSDKDKNRNKLSQMD